MEMMASAVPPFPPEDSGKDEPMEPKEEELEPIRRRNQMSMAMGS